MHGKRDKACFEGFERSKWAEEELEAASLNELSRAKEKNDA